MSAARLKVKKSIIKRNIPANFRGKEQVYPIILVAYAIFANTKEVQSVRKRNNVFLQVCKFDWLSMVMSFLVPVIAENVQASPAIILLWATTRNVTNPMIIKKLARITALRL